jgi:hypothetical protein
MFASATDNQTLSMLWHRNYDFYGNPRPAFDPSYDYESARRQIAFLRELAGRNTTWMQIVETPAQARTVMNAGKLAVVLSVELDTLTVAQITQLRVLGVRHVIPVHFADNGFGGPALYATSATGPEDENIFNTANRFLTGRFYSVVGDTNLSYRLGRPKVLHAHTNDFIKGGAVEPIAISDGEYAALAYAGVRGGHRNARRAQLGPIRQLMRLGLMLDVAHMSQATKGRALEGLLCDALHVRAERTHLCA